MRSMANLLTVENLKVEFRLQQGVVHAVKDVSFRVQPRSTVAVVGESGSGKSVIAQAILGILPKTAHITGGRILFNDPATDAPPIDIARLEPDSKTLLSLRGGRISMIFQEPMTSLSPLHTVGNQILEALHLHRSASAADGRALATEVLRLVGFPDPAKALRSYSFELSGGLRQRAMIAMALVCRPALLIADEPTTALDVTIQAQILKLLKELQSELGMALLLITHDLGVVANMAEEVVVMHHGQVVESGALEDIFSDPRHDYLKALLRAVPRFDMKPGERLVPLREIKHESGRLMAQLPADANRPPVDPTRPLLRIEGLTKTYRIRNAGLIRGTTQEVRALDDVGFDVWPGECLGLVGESGCGKTTLSKILMRATNPDSGSITYNDRDQSLDVLKMDRAGLLRYRRQVQYIFQDPFGSLNPRMTVFDIIREPLVIHKIGDDRSRSATVRELMEVVGLDARLLNRYPHSFSGGQRQRIGIARALALRPDLLICDEPVSALDVSIQAQVLNLLKDLKTELGLTYLFISHNLAVVDYMADRIAVMCAGRLVELAPREALFRNPVHPYTKALLSAVPEPDPRCCLDLSALMEGRASVPSAWPQPFTVDAAGGDRLVDLGDGHFVRASDPAKLLAMVA
ncbi:MAG: ABC transporter ATP-binding protein [Alphaproteobacteria bacterium]